jgi:hypothetical protein
MLQNISTVSFPCVGTEREQVLGDRAAGLCLDLRQHV